MALPCSQPGQTDCCSLSPLHALQRVDWCMTNRCLPHLPPLQAFPSELVSHTGKLACQAVQASHARLRTQCMGPALLSSLFS